MKVYIVSGSRTPIGSFGGSLAGTSAAELGVAAATEALRRAGISALDGKANTPVSASVDEVIVGNVLGAGHGMNIARQVAIKSGLAATTPAYTVNKVCGSGLKSVALAYSEILHGNAHVMLAGGTESMSQAAYVSLGTRFGARMGSSELKDVMLTDGLTDAFSGTHMGITAENVAEKYGISRQEQDAFAAESQRKAAAAQKAGKFSDEIIPVLLMKRGKPVGSCSADEYLRPDTTPEALAKLSPAFKRDGSVTAGNASGINDGAAMLVLMSEKAVQERKLSPLAEIVGIASAGVPPEIMGIGPVAATRKLLANTKLSISDFEVIEANEAFAVQALAVQKELELPASRVNPNGGAIALGHPIGASGARILVTLVHELKRTQGTYGLATLCIGGGQGIALAIKRC